MKSSTLTHPKAAPAATTVANGNSVATPARGAVTALHYALGEISDQALKTLRLIRLCDTDPDDADLRGELLACAELALQVIGAKADMVCLRTDARHSISQGEADEWLLSPGTRELLAALGEATR